MLWKNLNPNSHGGGANLAPPYGFSVITAKPLKIFFWNSLTFPHLVWGSRSWCQKICWCCSWCCSCSTFFRYEAGIDNKLNNLGNFDLLSPNFEHRDCLTFWIDSKGYCCCSCCPIAAFLLLQLQLQLQLQIEELLIWIHLLSLNLVYISSLIFWIDL